MESQRLGWGAVNNTIKILETQRMKKSKYCRLFKDAEKLFFDASAIVSTAGLDKSEIRQIAKGMDSTIEKLGKSGYKKCFKTKCTSCPEKQKFSSKDHRVCKCP